MFAQTSLPDVNASLPLYVEAAQDVASGRLTRFLWTAFSFGVLVLIVVSACALVPISSRALAKPSRLVPEVATFVPDMSSLSPVQQNQPQPLSVPSMSAIQKERQPISAMRMSGTDGKPLSRRAAVHAAAAAYVLVYKASPALAFAGEGGEKLTPIERRERREREEREDVLLRGIPKNLKGFPDVKTTNGYSYDNKEKGMYVGAISGAPLFESSAKYDTGKGSSAKEKYDLGRAAFYEAVPGSVIERASAQDYQQALITGFAALKIWGVPIGVVRTEIVDAKSGLLLGHVYNAGPREVLRNRLSTDVVRWTPSTSTTDPIFKRYLVNTAAMTFVPADHSSK